MILKNLALDQDYTFTCYVNITLTSFLFLARKTCHNLANPNCLSLVGTLKTQTNLSLSSFKISNESDWF